MAITRTFGLMMEWGLGKPVIRVRDPVIPFLATVEDTCSILYTEDENGVTTLQQQTLNVSINKTGNGLQVDWNTKETLNAAEIAQGGWYFRGEQVETETIAYFEQSAMNEVAYLISKQPGLSILTYRQHTIAKHRNRICFQFNAPSLWIPGRPCTNLNSWGPTLIEVMVVGMGPINSPAFCKFMEMGKALFGQHPLRIYREQFGCRADFMHGAFMQSEYAKQFIELQEHILRSPQNALGLKEKALEWLREGEYKELKKCIPWWLLDCDNNFEEILETPRNKMFVAARRTDTTHNSSAAIHAASTLGITKDIAAPNFLKNKKEKRVPVQLPPLNPQNLVVVTK